VSAAKLNAFCRRYDLIFVEYGRKNGEETYRFVDFNNEKRYYTYTEIKERLDRPTCAIKVA